MLQDRLMRQWLASITCCLSASMIATCFLWTTPLPRTWPPKPHSDWISSIMPLGMLIFALPAGLLADKFGRRAVLLQACPLVLVSWIVVITTYDVVALYVVRIIQGFAMAIVYVVAPIYLAEISETKNRGLFSGQFQVMYLVGAVYSYTMGTVLDYSDYTCSLLIFPIVAIVAFYTMPESPYFLVVSGKTLQAHESLKWLRASDDVDDEFTAMTDSVRQEETKLQHLVSSDSDKRSLYIVIVLSTLRSLCGMNAVSVFLVQELTDDAKGIISPKPMAVALMAVSLVSTFALTFISDSVGRKPVLIFSTIGSTAFCAMVAVYYSLEANVDRHVWIMFVATVGFSVSYNAGLGGLMQTIQGEYFPYRTRAMGGSVVAIISGLLTFVSLQLYVTLRAHGHYLNYIMYTLVSLIGTMVIPVAHHETACRTLIQIQEVGICRKKSQSTARNEANST